jgi:integrase/recombinase XerD
MRRDPRTDAPDFFSFARDYLHAYMPKTRGLSPKTIEAYRISLECFLGYLADNEHIERDRVSFDHFDRQHLKRMADLDDRSAALRAQDRHVASERG